MKFKQILLAASLSVLAAGCFNDDDLWNKINEQDEQIAALETWQKQANTNIQSLQALMDGMDYITDVKPLSENGAQVGYTISFAKKEPINIYNGADGQDAPAVSVMKAEDGLYYWTLNGTQMKDAAGNPMRASGPKGVQGEDGIAAPLPQLKTGKALTDDGVAGTWDATAFYLSIDNATTWTKVSGDKGDAGESYFEAIDATTDDDYVLFTLQGGTPLSVPKYKAINLSFKLNGTPVVDLAAGLKMGAGDELTYELTGSAVTEENKADFRIAITNSNADWTPVLDRFKGSILFTDYGFDNTLLTVKVNDNKSLARTYVLPIANSGIDWYLNPVSADYYTVSSQADLVTLAKLTNGKGLPMDMNATDFAGKTIKLANDIVMSENAEWAPINDFYGTFDGQNHSIKGTIKYILTGKSVGLFGEGMRGTIENLEMEAKLLNIENRSNVGGIVAILSTGAVVRNCVNHSDLKCGTSSTSIGGVVASMLVEALVEGCVNTGYVEGCNAGGVVGTGYHNKAKVIGCINKGAIRIVTSMDGTMGGAILDGQSCLVTACWSNSPSITSLNDAQLGAIAGVNYLETSHCYWKTLPNISEAIFDGDKTQVKDCAAFDTDTPSAQQIADMNAAWAAANPERTLQFNATTGEIEPLAAN